MENFSKASVTVHDVQKDRFLSTASIEQSESPSTRGRSSSLSPSLRSFRSGRTEVYNEPVPEPAHEPAYKKRKFKTITKNVDIELSFWDCVKGLNPFRKRARTVPVTVEVTDEADDMDSDEYEVCARA
jgi:hypothetical protein